MKQLKTVLSDMQTNAGTNSGSSDISPTPQPGLTESAGRTITAYSPKTRPSLDELMAIQSRLSSIKPWQIKPTDQALARSALQLLASSLIPATFEEASVLIGRALAHFPRRDPDKDAIIVSDLAGVIESEGLSLMAVHMVCRETWQNATDENPWFAPSGKLLTKIREQHQSFRWQAERLANPKPELPAPSAPARKPDPAPDQNDPLGPCYGRKWDALSEEERSVLLAEAKKHKQPMRGMMMSLWFVPDEIVAALEAELAPPPPPVVTERNSPVADSVTAGTTEGLI